LKGVVGFGHQQTPPLTTSEVGHGFLNTVYIVN